MRVRAAWRVQQLIRAQLYRTTRVTILGRNESWRFWFRFEYSSGDAQGSARDADPHLASVARQQGLTSTQAPSPCRAIVPPLRPARCVLPSKPLAPADATGGEYWPAAMWPGDGRGIRRPWYGRAREAPYPASSCATEAFLSANAWSRYPMGKSVKPPTALSRSR